MSDTLNLGEQDVQDALAYAGLVLLAFELLKGMIVKPIKAFYANTTFSGCPFVSYEQDVLSRHRNEFEACLLYLRDFMEAINAEDMASIQNLRKHRNELAHNLPYYLSTLHIENYAELFRTTERVLFKLSNYRTYIEIGADPEFKGLGIDWNTVNGHEYLLYEEVLSKLQSLKSRLQG
jgi:hypothetical protein